MDIDRRSLVADLGLALVVAAVAGVATAVGVDELSSSDRPVDALAVALVVVAGLALAFRRQNPELTLLVVTACLTAYLLRSYPYGLVFVALLVAVYSLARHRPLRRAAWASTVAVVAMLTHLLVHPAALPGWLGLVPGTAWVVVPFAVGAMLRSVADGAARERAEALREQVMGERLRVAHEVHDVVGHGLAAIQMQADIALHVMDHDPTQGRRALEAISRSSEQAMNELRSTLQVVRRDAPRTPGPGTADLEALCERIRDAGVDVDLAVHGRPRTLPMAVDLAAYRLVQESLTNVVRHGSTPRASVYMEYGEERLTLRVENPGPAGRANPAGLGIEGMRRRVTELGGTFSAGATGHAFTTSAELPTGEPT